MSEWDAESGFQAMCEVSWKTCVECAATFGIDIRAAKTLGDLMDLVGVDFDVDLVGGASEEQRGQIKQQLRNYAPITRRH